MKKILTYKASGVDIKEGGMLVSLIKPLAKSTCVKGVIGSIGGFGGLFSARFKGLKDPVLVSSTDGVGTKLKIAFMADSHSTIGIDLVAMCVNDIVTTGAMPLFFLDYFATGKLNARKSSTIIKGIAKGCIEAHCALIGGETAEMPGIYKDNEYDLAGFAVGVVEKKKLIDGSRIKPGDKIIGIASSGLHSNGYSLARKLIFDTLKLRLTDKPKGFRKPICKELLTPTRIYVKTMLNLKKSFDILGAAHITGGGFTENIPRVLPENTKAVIYKNSWKIPFVFKYMQNKGNITDEEMFKTFNMGIGMVIVVESKDINAVIKKLRLMGETAHQIGIIEKKREKIPTVEFV